MYTGTCAQKPTEEQVHVQEDSVPASTGFGDEDTEKAGAEVRE